MNPNNLFLFLDDLLEQTKAGKLKWKETGDEESFRLTLKNGMIRIERKFSEDNEIFVLVILDKENREIERISSVSDANGQGYSVDPAQVPALLKDLWYHARRIALQTESVVDSLWEEIKSFS